MAREALIHEARGERAAADAVLAEIDAWMGGGERPRLWAMPQAAVAMARRGDFARARALLRHLAGDHRLYHARELEARCSLVAEERAWAEDRRSSPRRAAHAEVGELHALPLPRRPARGPRAARRRRRRGRARPARAGRRRLPAARRRLGGRAQRARARRGARGTRPRRRRRGQRRERRRGVRAAARAARARAGAGAAQPPAGAPSLISARGSCSRGAAGAPGATRGASRARATPAWDSRGRT